MDQSDFRMICAARGIVVRTLKNNGMSVRQIADQLMVSNARVRQLLRSADGFDNDSVASALLRASEFVGAQAKVE